MPSPALPGEARGSPSRPGQPGGGCAEPMGTRFQPVFPRSPKPANTLCSPCCSLTPLSPCRGLYRSLRGRLRGERYHHRETAPSPSLTLPPPCSQQQLPGASGDGSGRKKEQKSSAEKRGGTFASLSARCECSPRQRQPGEGRLPGAVQHGRSPAPAAAGNAPAPTAAGSVSPAWLPVVTGAGPGGASRPVPTSASAAGAAGGSQGGAGASRALPAGRENGSPRLCLDARGRHQPRHRHRHRRGPGRSGDRGVRSAALVTHRESRRAQTAAAGTPCPSRRGSRRGGDRDAAGCGPESRR